VDSTRSTHTPLGRGASSDLAQVTHAYAEMQCQAAGETCSSAAPKDSQPAQADPDELQRLHQSVHEFDDRNHKD
jgi:hypothetical protein